jgi:glyoxylase-like metal-dependent hydrolase (beta-lactamase superfamily II)
MTIGRYDVVSVVDSVGDLDDPGGMLDEFLSPSNEAWEPYRAQYPELFAANGAWRLYVRALLIRDSARAIVVDTGVGPLSAPAASWFHIPGALLDEISAAGTDPTEVNAVVITHVHDDHIGGTCTEDRKPAFENARYLIHRDDVEWCRQDAMRDPRDQAPWDLLLGPIASSGQLVEIDDAFEVAPGIRTRHLPGHTPGHQGVELEDGADSLLITGDTFNHPAQLDHPDWAGTSDNDPRAATALRRVVLEELLQNDRLIAPLHFAEPFGRVAKKRGAVTWKPE